jgi:hypothetical protein
LIIEHYSSSDVYYPMRKRNSWGGAREGAGRPNRGTDRLRVVAMIDYENLVYLEMTMAEHRSKDNLINRSDVLNAILSTFAKNNPLPSMLQMGSLPPKFDKPEFRGLVLALCKKMTGKSLPEIALALAGEGPCWDVSAPEMYAVLDELQKRGELKTMAT